MIGEAISLTFAILGAAAVYGTDVSFWFFTDLSTPLGAEETGRGPWLI